MAPPTHSTTADSASSLSSAAGLFLLTGVSAGAVFFLFALRFCKNFGNRSGCLFQQLFSVWPFFPQHPQTTFRSETATVDCAAMITSCRRDLSSAHAQAITSLIVIALAVDRASFSPAPSPGYLDSQNAKYFPLELRQLIWQLAMPDPVIIIIGLEDAEEALQNVRPNLFRVCRESRVELLKQYEIIEGFYKTPLYIDFSRDAIHLTDSALEKHSLDILNLLAAKTQRLTYCFRLRSMQALSERGGFRRLSARMNEIWENEFLN